MTGEQRRQPFVERLALAKRLAARADPFPELFAKLGFADAVEAVEAVEAGPDTYHAVHASWLIHPIRAPTVLDHRYLHEDVGWGLVPWMQLAAAADCSTPTIDGLINLASAINDVNYSRHGLTLERMGLHEKSAEQMRSYVGAPIAAI